MKYLRKLTESEVTFTVSCEQDDIPLSGNVLDCGDDEEDRAAEQEIRERLERGDESAWCCILVKAEWRGRVGYASIGGNTLAGGTGREVAAQVEEIVTEYGMRDEALHDLNADLARELEELSALVCE